jgi:hypothetical protein
MAQAGFAGKIYCTHSTAKLMAARMDLVLDEPSADADEERLANLHGRLVCPCPAIRN